MKKNIFERLAASEPIDMRDPDFLPAITQMDKTRKLCFKINHTYPDGELLRPMMEEMLEQRLEEGTNLLSPIQIDFGNQMHLGKHVFINHSFMASAAAGITIDDNVQIAPQVSIITVNHDLNDRMIVICKPVHIKKGAWIGANVSILPGVTIGENAVVGTGAVVTKDVPDNTVVVGNPARVIKMID